MPARKITEAESLSPKLHDALVALSAGAMTVYDLAGSLFNERYGITASRAGGRLQLLKRRGFAERVGRVWRITPAGRRSLSGEEGVR